MIANKWDDIFTQTEWGKYPPEYIVRPVMQTFKSVENRSQVRFLDVGCGPGAVSWFLAREGFHVTGFDSSREAVRQAEKRLDGLGHWDGHLLVGDFTKQFIWMDESFDCVIDNMSLTMADHHDAIQAYDEIHRMLKPGGKLISVLASMKSCNVATELRGATLWNMGDVSIVLSAFHRLNMEVYSRTVRNGSGVVSQLVIEATKQ